MGSCLTVNHTLPSGRTLLIWSDLFVAGSVVSWRIVSWEGEKGGRVVNWDGSKGVSLVNWKGGKGGRIVR